MGDQYLKVMGMLTCSFGGGIVLAKLFWYMLDCWWRLYRLCVYLPAIKRRADYLTKQNESEG